MNILKIRDREFKIISATISQIENESGKFFWNITVKTESKIFDGERWQPKIVAESIPVNAPSFEEIVGKEIEIKDAFDKETNEYLITMYIFEHADVWDSKIKFISRDNNKFLISWVGKCNVHWDGKEYGLDVPFRIDSEFEIV